jgi:AraC-like DNA-binding protein
MKTSASQQGLTDRYFAEMNRHLDDIAHGRADKMHSIKDVANNLHVHPRHLSNTVKAVTGYSPCHFFEGKLIEIAKNLLAQQKLSIRDIAFQMTFDPSNFTKFFKKYTGQTPGEYRAAILQAIRN